MGSYTRYANNHLNVFIQEKGPKKSILIQNPKPSNFKEAISMDESIVQLLKEKNQKALSENQNQIDVMGPFETLQHALKQTNKEG